MLLQSLVFCDWVFFYWQHQNEFIIRYHRTNKRIKRKRIYFPKYRMMKITCTKDVFGVNHKKKEIADTKKTLLSLHFIEKDKWVKYLSGLLSIVID